MADTQNATALQDIPLTTPVYTAAEVDGKIVAPPVTSVNTKTGAVVLDASEIVNPSSPTQGASVASDIYALYQSKAAADDLRYAIDAEPRLPDSSGVVTLDDRTVNLVALTETIATLTLDFPASISGRARDFLVRIDAASGVSAPEIALPVGVVAENADGAIPAIATTTESGATACTLLYFSETVAGHFLLKGENVKAVANE